jgi:GxxExxY protein
MSFIADPLVETVIGCAIEVHRELGPGLLETAYSPCLGLELREKRIAYRTEVSVPLRYKSVLMEPAYRVDFLIEGWLVVEVKAVAGILPIHVAQIVTYLRLLKARQGLIMNFNVRRLKDGVKSVIAKDAMVDVEPALDSAGG